MSEVHAPPLMGARPPMGNPGSATGIYQIFTVTKFISNFEPCTQNNGHISEWFSVSRGCRQGYNLSPLLYLLCGELLAQKIRENSHMKEVEIYDIISVISQFADDTNLFLSFKKATLGAVIDTLDIIQINTGLKVNYDKTKLYRIGSLANSIYAKLYTDKKFTWINEPV